MQVIQGKNRPRYSFLTPCTSSPEHRINARQKMITIAPPDCMAVSFKIRISFNIRISWLILQILKLFLTGFQVCFKVGKVELRWISSSHHITCVCNDYHRKELYVMKINNYWWNLSVEATNLSYCCVVCHCKGSFPDIHVPEARRPTGCHRRHDDGVWSRIWS